MRPVGLTLPRALSISLVMLIILASMFSVQFEISKMTVHSSATLVSLSGVHRTYRLRGDATQNWNGTGNNPGPLITAADGDLVTIMLQSADGHTHNWALKADTSYPIVSQDFSDKINWMNFTFTATLNPTNGIPHGGLFQYVCQYHAAFMFGDFKFIAGPVSSFTYSPPAPLVGHTVSFDGSASWPSTSASISTYTWDFGDGNVTSSTTPSITHAYSAAESYSAKLNVTDSSSQSAVSSRIVSVQKIPTVPFDYSVSLSQDSSRMLLGQTASLTVTLNTVSGASENITLSSSLFPTSPTIHVSLNRYDGFPPFSAKLQVIADSTSRIGTYVVTIAATSSSGVNHNATLTVSLISGQQTTPIISPELFSWMIWAAVGASGMALFVMVMLLRKKETSH